MLRINRRVNIVLLILYTVFVLYLMLVGFQRESLLDTSSYHYELNVLPLPLYLPNSDSFSSWQQFFIDLGNLLLFIPFGLLIASVFNTKLIKTMLLFIIFISIVEFFQMFSYRGVFDVKDIIMNSIGCFIGYLAYRFSVYQNQYDIIKIFCMIFTLVALTFVAIIYINQQF